MMHINRLFTLVLETISKFGCASGGLSISTRVAQRF